MMQLNDPAVKLRKAKELMRAAELRARDQKTAASILSLQAAQDRLKIALAMWNKTKADEQIGFMCDGKAQSPINIQPRRALPAQKTFNARWSFLYVPMVLKPSRKNAQMRLIVSPGKHGMP